MKRTLFFSALVLSSCGHLSGQTGDRGPARNALPLCEKIQTLEVHAHRGAGDRPENTLAAFLRAHEQGADFIEMDVQVTKDNRLILAHDIYVREECRPHGSNSLFYRKMSMAQVRQLRCHPTHLKAHVPELKDLLKEMKGAQTPRENPLSFNIEIKFSSQKAEFYPPRKEYAELLSEVLDSAGIEEHRILVQSFDHEFLKVLKQVRPQTALSPLLTDMKDGKEIARSLEAKLVTPHEGLLTQANVQEFQKAGFRVIPWTVNDPKRARELIELGIDGLITDRAEWLSLIKKLCAGGKDN